MTGYSGTASFEFEIERYKDKETGTLYSNSAIGDNEFEYEYTVIPLTIEGSSYFQPGKFSALPEDCYPDEGDTEITSVIGPDGKSWEEELTDEERDRIISMIQDSISDDEPDVDDYEDDYEDDFPYEEDVD